MKDIRILIADDHAIVRMGLRALMETHPGLIIVGEAEDGESAVRLAAELHPDVVIMDYMMPVIDGAEATEKILGACPGTKIIILTSYVTAEGIARAIRAGAVGAIVKNSETQELVKAIRTVIGGGRTVSPEFDSILAESGEIKRLSDHQELVLGLIVRGLTNRDIARHLGIQEDSVKKIVQVIFEKIGAANRAEAVSIALRKHLLKA